MLPEKYTSTNQYPQRICINNRLRDSIFTTVCCCFIFVLPAWSQDVLTLEKAIQLGLSHNKNILSGLTEVNVSRLQTNALYRRYMPRISADYSYVYNPVLPTSILPVGIFNPDLPQDATQNVRFGTAWSQSAGLTIEQPVLDYSIKRKMEEARLLEKIAGTSNEETAYELAFAILSSYINVYLLESGLQESVADSVRTYISYTLQQTRFDENRLLKSDVNKAKINHNNSIQRVEEAKSRIQEEKLFLLFLTGEENPRGDDFVIDSGFFNNDVLSWIDKSPAPDQLPKINTLSLRSKLTALQTASEKARYLPVVGLKAYLGANQFSDTFNPFAAGSWFGMSFVGISVNIPVLTGESLSNRLQQIQVQAYRYTLEKDIILEEMNKDALVIRLRTENMKKRIQTLRDNLSLSGESLLIFQERFREGAESAATLNSEEAAYQFMKSEYETEKKRMWLQWLDYIKISGRLSELIP